MRVSSGLREQENIVAPSLWKYERKQEQKGVLIQLMSSQMNVSGISVRTYESVDLNYQFLIVNSFVGNTMVLRLLALCSAGMDGI